MASSHPWDTTLVQRLRSAPRGRGAVPIAAKQSGHSYMLSMQQPIGRGHCPGSAGACMQKEDGV